MSLIFTGMLGLGAGLVGGFLVGIVAAVDAFNKKELVMAQKAEMYRGKYLERSRQISLMYQTSMGILQPLGQSVSNYDATDGGTGVAQIPISADESGRKKIIDAVVVNNAIMAVVQNDINLEIGENHGSNNTD